MNKFAIIGARKAPRTGYMAIISGALLGAVAAAGPAQSGDLSIPYQYTGYRYGPGYNGYNNGYNGYNRNCYSCGCYRCGCYQCGCCGVARNYENYGNYGNYGLVAERHWVERNYWERRYPISSPRYPAYGYRYPYNPGPYYSGWGSPRPHLGYGGIQYPPAPVSYEYDAPRRPFYDEASLRPPAGIPGAYYNGGYFEPGSMRSPAGAPGAYYNGGYFEPGSMRPPAGAPGAYYDAGYEEGLPRPPAGVPYHNAGYVE